MADVTDEKAWETAIEESDKAGSGKFVRLKAGERAIFSFCSTPVVKRTYYNEATKKSEPYSPQHKAEGKSERVSFVFSVYCPPVATQNQGKSQKIIVQPGQGSKKIFECSNTVFKDVVKNKDKYGLNTRFFELERTGTTKNDTTYSVLPDVEISTEHLGYMKSIPDLDLMAEDDETTDMNSHGKAAGTNGTAGHAKPAQAATPAPTEEPTIEQTESASIIQRVKALPEALRKEFLESLGVPQVKLVKRSQLATVLAKLTELESRLKPATPPPAPAAQPVEVDPFA